MTAAPIELVFIPYIAIAVALTFWVARALTRNGEVFLRDVFPQNHALADALNRLLAIGFYLVNLGWALLLVHQGAAEATTPLAAIDLLANKLGLLMLLGGAHLANLYVFHRLRRGGAPATGRL